MSKQLLVVERHTKRTINGKLLASQLKRCADISLKSGRGRGWDYKIGGIPQPKANGDEWIYTIPIAYSTTSKRASLDEKWPAIVSRFAQTSSAGSFRGAPWVVVKPEGYANVAVAAKAANQQAITMQQKADEPKNYGNLNLDMGDNFNRIYGREAHIRMVVDAIKLAVNTDYSKRVNTIFYGSAGSGKSELMAALARMLGKEREAYLWFDATSMTRAGAIEELMNAPVIPGVLFLEEAEKTEESALRWLLGVMDHRGQVRRVNYRVGNQCRNVRMIVIATANDVKLLESMMAGALYSRFQQKIYCPPPERVVMKQILTREIADIKGNPDWIEPALQFGFDEWGMTDPRSIITICTCGGDRLLTGDYQRDYVATMFPADRERLLKAKVKKG